MLYLNGKLTIEYMRTNENLTLTSVVFEYEIFHITFGTFTDLTLTSVVFESYY